VLSVQGLRGYEWATHVLPICLLMAATWQFLGTTFGGYKILKANKNEKFWKNKEKWETVQYFFREGVKATKEGWRNDCFCLNDKGVNQEDWMSLFDRIQPLNQKYIDTILDPKMSVKKKKIAQKTYNHASVSVRTNHWKKLETLYFVDNLDGIQQVNDKWKNYFVPDKPLDDHANQNSWRRGGCQKLLVFGATILGLNCYLAIGGKVETEAAVQEGMEVLKDVIFFQWLAFAAYNIIVLIYYHKSIINNIKSGWDFIRSILSCTWCRASNEDLEATFAPTWDETMELLEGDNQEYITHV